MLISSAYNLYVRAFYFLDFLIFFRYIRSMSFQEKLNLKYGELVRIKNTGEIAIDGKFQLQGKIVKVVGIANVYILDTYILEFINQDVGNMPDFGKYTAFVMSESCLERVD